MPFKTDTPKDQHQNVGNVPSVQDSSTGIRHSSDILGNLLATKEEGMNLMTHDKKKKHSAKYYKDI